MRSFAYEAVHNKESMQRVLIVYCFIYAKGPYYLLLYMQRVLIIYCFICNVQVLTPFQVYFTTDDVQYDETYSIWMAAIKVIVVTSRTYFESRPAVYISISRATLTPPWCPRIFITLDSRY